MPKTISIIVKNTTTSFKLYITTAITKLVSYLSAVFSKRHSLFAQQSPVLTIKSP